MKDYRDKLHDLLAEVNHREGMTRYKIAKRSGVSEQTISNVISKRRNLSLPALEKLLESLGYEIDFAPSSRLNAASTQSLADVEPSTTPLPQNQPQVS